MARLEAIKNLIGDLARPLAIILTSLSAAVATITIAFRVDAFDDGAIFIAAVYAGVGAIYGAKAWEVAKIGKQRAEVDIARSAAGESPAQERGAEEAT